MWLRCKVARGMFPHELAIVIEAQGLGKVSLFLPRHKVRSAAGADADRQTEGAIPVALLKTEGGVSAVALPEATLEGPTVVRVAHEELTGA